MSRYLQRWELTILIHQHCLCYIYWDFCIKVYSVKKRFRFYFDQSGRRNEFLTREKVVSSNHKPRFRRIVFSRSWRVALSGSFDKIIFPCTRVVGSSNLSRARRYIWGWLNNQEDLCLDKPIDKFIKDQKNKNTLSKTRRDVSLPTEFLSSKNESRRIEERRRASLMNISVNIL